MKSGSTEIWNGVGFVMFWGNAKLSALSCAVDAATAEPRASPVIRKWRSDIGTAGVKSVVKATEYRAFYRADEGASHLIEHCNLYLAHFDSEDQYCSLDPNPPPNN